ncbi:MAG: hypothetical protein GY861_07815 [bacterium]|nr:hypothetical protein [bacterium]
MKIKHILIVLTVLLMFAAWLSTAGIASDTNINIVEDGFSPSEVTITVGDSITWKNTNEFVHVLYSRKLDARFTSPVVKSGETYTYTYEKPGDFDFYVVDWGFKGIAHVVEKEEEPAPKPEPEPAPEPECTTCADGCTKDANDCSVCKCPCSSDADCNDNDPCTTDSCASNPVKCANTKQPGCAHNNECIAEGTEMDIDGKLQVCTTGTFKEKQVAVPEKETLSPALKMAIFVIVLVVILLIIKTKQKPKKQKKAAKNKKKKPVIPRKKNMRTP